MELTLPLQPNLLLPLFNTGLAEYGSSCYCCYSLTNSRTAWLHGSEWRVKPGRQRCHQRFESLESWCSNDRRVPVKDHHCRPKFWRHHGPSTPCHSFGLFPLYICDPSIGPNGNTSLSMSGGHLLIPLRFRTTDSYPPVCNRPCRTFSTSSSHATHPMTAAHLLCLSTAFSRHPTLSSPKRCPLIQLPV